MHLVFRLCDHPLRLYETANDELGQDIGLAIVGGARPTYYVLDISKPIRSVGVQFEPGAADLLLGVPAQGIEQGRRSELAAASSHHEASDRLF